MTELINADAPPIGFKKRDKQRLSTRARLLCLDDLDGRTRACANARQLIASIQADIGTDLSSGQMELAKRAALLSVIAEHAEAQWLMGKPIVISDYNAVVNSLRRVFETLGLHEARKVKTINAGDSNTAFLKEIVGYLREDDEAEASAEASAEAAAEPTP
jgi:hypothetical protein